MTKIKDLHELFVHSLKDLHSAERQIILALPLMIKNTKDEDLKNSFEEHMQQSKTQMDRIEQIAKNLSIKNIDESSCPGIQGIIAEAEQLIQKLSSTENSLVDAALISVAQRIEHYEIAAYGCTIEWAKIMEHNKEADILIETINEEKQTDKKLSKLAEKINLDVNGGKKGME